MARAELSENTVMKSPENFDGRGFFYYRRHNIKEDMNNWAFKSINNPRLLDEWTSQLFNLLREEWGILRHVKYDIRYGDVHGQEKIDKFLSLHPEFRPAFEKGDLSLRYVLEQKLIDVRRKIIASYIHRINKDGKSEVVIDTAKLGDVFLELHLITTEFGDAEYDKNLDLPQKYNPAVAILEDD